MPLASRSNQLNLVLDPARLSQAAAGSTGRSTGVQPCSVRRGGRAAMSANNCLRFTLRNRPTLRAP
eukprot:2508573-Prymnesium_polylepis.1